MSHRRMLFLKLFDGEQQEHARPVAERESCRQLPFRAPVQTQTPRGLAGLRGTGRPLGRV